MAEAQYAHNRTVEPETGFLENNGYQSAFDAQRKKLFIETMVDNGLSVYNTCKALKLSHHTFFHHIKTDPVFKQVFEEAKNIYRDRLAGISMKNAMNPRSVIERIFQLKWLYPERYADQKGQQSPNIVINIDTEALRHANMRVETLDAELVNDEKDGIISTPDTGLKQIDSQSDVIASDAHAPESRQ